MDTMKEGDRCEGFDTYAKYVIDSDGNCVMDRCLYGYKKEDGICVIREVGNVPVVESLVTGPGDQLDLEITRPITRPIVTRPIVTRPIVTRPIVTRPIVTRADSY